MFDVWKYNSKKPNVAFTLFFIMFIHCPYLFCVYFCLPVTQPFHIT